MLRKNLSLIFIFMLFTYPLSAQQRTKTVTDGMGRTKTIPVEITKVFSTNPMGTMFMYYINPGKIAGLNSALSAIEKKYTTPLYQKLPCLGGSFGGKMNTMNYEEILKVKPDIILAIGDMDPMAKSEADNLEKKLGIPVLLFDGNIENSSDTFLKIGEMTGDIKKAKLLSDYLNRLLKDTKEIAAKIPDNKRVRLYYAESIKGLETDPKGSRHSELIELCGGVNVAETKIQRGYGRTEVSIEQIISWNPELILICTEQGSGGDSLFNKIYSDKLWADIKAVKNKQVYEIPYGPFNWFDRPPSANRIIGIKWLSNFLYPEYFKYDIKKETKDFFKLFYGRVLTGSEVDDILKNSIRKK